MLLWQSFRANSSQTDCTWIQLSSSHHLFCFYILTNNNKLKYSFSKFISKVVCQLLTPQKTCQSLFHHLPINEVHKFNCQIIKFYIFFWKLLSTFVLIFLFSFLVCLYCFLIVVVYLFQFFVFIMYICMVSQFLQGFQP